MVQSIQRLESSSLGLIQWMYQCCNASCSSLHLELYKSCIPSQGPYRCRCALKWRRRFESSYAVTPAQLALFDQGHCPRCLGICACKRCLSKPSPAVGGAAPAFAKHQEQQFALHTLAVLKPHIADFLAARDAEVKLTHIFASPTRPHQSDHVAALADCLDTHSKTVCCTYHFLTACSATVEVDRLQA